MTVFLWFVVWFIVGLAILFGVGYALGPLFDWLRERD